jgi:hypothetical protein
VKTITATGVFLAWVFLLDVGLGFGLARLYRSTNSGDTGGLINYALSRHPQVLLLGSSRMKHHVSPAVLSKKLSLSAFNAGVDGQDFLYAAMLLDLWKAHHNPPPSVVVLHVDQPSFSRGEQELSRAKVFSFYFNQSALVREVMSERGPFERIKYLSRSYRANGRVLGILKNCLRRQNSQFDGYSELEGSLAPRPSSPATTRADSQAKPEAYWPRKIVWFGQMVAYCQEHHTRLILITSPRYSEPRNEHEAWVGNLRALLARFPGVEFLDISQYTHPELFAEKPDLFKDDSHLNAAGSVILTELLAAEIQARMLTVSTGPASPR